MAGPLDRNKILDAARVVFARHGFRKASLSDIVRPLGVAKTALYHHFPRGKEEIFHAVIQREEEKVLGDMERALGDGQPPPRQMRALILAKLKHFHQLRALLKVPRDVGEEVAQIYASHETSFRTSEKAMIADLLRRGQDSRLFRALDPERLAKHIQMILVRLELCLVFDQTPETMEGEVDDLLALLFNGIMRPEARENG